MNGPIWSRSPRWDGAAEQITRARILLKADGNQPGGSWLNKDIAAALDVGVATVERMS